ncbi:hypothetical protein Syun_028032 [Stephania yunnanensis]|uniref:Uncharacterized protein n=1 Tax=Stephania yunnanensis TaxID=152371 RepID=A0AAP0HQR7_9MAGN
MISLMEHLLSSGEVQVNPAMDSSYPHNYGRSENSHYNNVNGVDKPEKPQIQSEEDQLLLLVQPPTLPCTFGTPYKGLELREHLQIFYTADTFVLDDPDTIDSFVLEVLDELLNLKEGVHASLPNYVVAPFVVDISKGEGIT